MTQQPSIIERAFQLAEGCARLEEVRVKLKAEGYGNVDAHLTSKSLRTDLIKRLKA
jgi:hypothetical protein